MENTTTINNNQQTSLLSVLMKRIPKVSRIVNDLPNKSKTPLEKCISRIDNEINLIKNRTNLDLLKVSKKIKGKEKLQNEVRFWKHLKDENEGMIGYNIKYKGFHIYTETDQLIKIPNDKDLLIECLEVMKEEILIYDDNHTIFQQIQTIDDNIKKSKDERNERIKQQKSNDLYELTESVNGSETMKVNE